MTVKLAKLEVPALLRLRTEIDARLTALRDRLSQQLSLLIGNAPAAERRKPGAKRRHALKGTRRPAKYRDPETGKTWAGVGMTPLWIRRYEEAGKERGQFATSASGSAPKAPGKKNLKKQRGKKAARK